MSAIYWIAQWKAYCATLNGKRAVGGDAGQGLVDYALIIALVALVLVGALTQLGGGISEIFMHISSALGIGGG
ncbi:MAG: hypothetical protein U0350_11520 [Caldilineaceae bacterium]